MPVNPPASSLQKKRLFQKQIPTLLGIGVLVVALTAGVLLFSQGTGVFAPRATPQTTPKKVRITNVGDASFTVSFFTDEATSGYIKYGTAVDALKSQASDDRDQLSGSVGQYNVHHVTVRGLEPETTYHFTLGTGTAASFDNNGAPFTVSTAKRSGIPTAAKTIYGSVVTPAGSPAEGAVVYVTLPGVGEMSSLVKSSGSWAVPLSNARTTDGSQYATIGDDDMLTIQAQGSSSTLVSEITAAVSQAQPVGTITLGQSSQSVATDLTAPASPSPTPMASESAGLTELTTASTSADASTSATTAQGGGLTDLLGSETAGASGSAGTQTTTEAPKTTINLATTAEAAPPTLDTTQPTIIGTAAPNVVVTIQVNSETQINQTLTADGNGGFTLDIAALSKELEPGEHTVTYSYTDPKTNKLVTKTQTFYVADTARTKSQLAMADTSGSSTTLAAATSPSPTPYSSGSPYPIGGATTSATATKSTTTATRSSVPSTSSGIPKSGSVGTTFALIFGGLFFLTAGGWSFWIAQRLEEEVM